MASTPTPAGFRREGSNNSGNSSTQDASAHRRHNDIARRGDMSAAGAGVASAVSPTAVHRGGRLRSELSPPPSIRSSGASTPGLSSPAALHHEIHDLRRIARHARAPRVVRSSSTTLSSSQLVPMPDTRDGTMIGSNASSPRSSAAAGQSGSGAPTPSASTNVIPIGIIGVSPPSTSLHLSSSPPLYMPPPPLANQQSQHASPPVRAQLQPLPPLQPPPVLVPRANSFSSIDSPPKTTNSSGSSPASAIQMQSASPSPGTTTTTTTTTSGATATATATTTASAAAAAVAAAKGAPLISLLSDCGVNNSSTWAAGNGAVSISAGLSGIGGGGGGAPLSGALTSSITVLPSGAAGGAGATAGPSSSSSAAGGAGIGGGGGAGVDTRAPSRHEPGNRGGLLGQTSSFRIMSASASGGTPQSMSAGSPQSISTGSPNSSVNNGGILPRGTPSAYQFYKHQSVYREGLRRFSGSPSNSPNSSTSHPHMTFNASVNNESPQGRSRTSSSMGMSQTMNSYQSGQPGLISIVMPDGTTQQHVTNLSFATAAGLSTPSICGRAMLAASGSSTSHHPSSALPESIFRRLPGGWVADASVAPYLMSTSGDVMAAAAAASSLVPPSRDGSGSDVGPSSSNSAVRQPSNDSALASSSERSGPDEHSSSNNPFINSVTAAYATSITNVIINNSSAPPVPPALMPSQVRRGSGYSAVAAAVANAAASSPGASAGSPARGTHSRDVSAAVDASGNSVRQQERPESPTFLPGHHYSVIRTLGKGSFSRVYLVRDCRSEQQQYYVDKVMKWDANDTTTTPDHATRQQTTTTHASTGNNNNVSNNQNNNNNNSNNNTANNNNNNYNDGHGNRTQGQGQQHAQRKPSGNAAADEAEEDAAAAKRQAAERLIADRRKLARRDVELLANCAHPSIVHFIESYETETATHLIVEHVDGGDLSKELERRKMLARPLRVEVVLRYFVQLALALDYLHRSNVVHRDVKPQNVLISRGNDGFLKLADFGFAARKHEERGEQYGTPFYAAPEMWRPVDHSAACDVWSLGVVLYELLSMRLPFTRNSTATHMVTSDAACVIPPLPQSTPEELVAVVASALRYRPEDRPSVRQLLQSSMLMRGALLELLEVSTRSRTMHADMKQVLQEHVASIVGREAVEALQRRQTENNTTTTTTTSTTTTTATAGAPSNALSAVAANNNSGRMSPSPTRQQQQQQRGQN